MSKTISFRASEELDEFLEQEAEERMTTKSAAAQMLLAERVRQIQADREGGEGGGDDLTESVDDGLGEDESDLPEIFSKYDDRWYRPNSQDNNFAVHPAEGSKRYYYKTAENAAKRLKKEYGE